MLAYAKANPGKLNVGHAGVGTTNHIALLRLQAAEKVEFNVIPYKGSGPGLNDVVAGQIDGYTDQLSSSSPQIKAGKLRALLALSKDRVPDLPDVPTLAELGHPGLDCVTPAGIFAPAATPAPIIAKLNQAANKALADEGVRKRYAEIGSLPRPMSPAEFMAFLRVEESAINGLAQAGVLKPD
jgi:tripartite-type tricarboxylate transporter receptor subunit TctC